ncbi:MAG: NADH:flavin oxidoreductase [Microthrixaceae bacterium]
MIRAHSGDDTDRSDYSSARPDPFAPARLGPLTLRNRVLKAATFEGVMPRGAVTDRLVEFHREVAAGGVAMSTVAYCAVSMGGRVHRDTMVMRPGIARDLARVAEAVHDEGALVAAQLGHAGLVANTRSNGCATAAPSTRFSPAAMALVRGLDHDGIEAIIREFAAATQVVEEAGFDAVELHLGHNYLLSSFMSPNLNRRRDEYGGTVENRMRFPLRVVEAVRGSLGSHMALTVKFNMVDGVPSGLWLDDSLPMAALIEAQGMVDAIELTGGSSLLNAMYYFRGDVPMREFAATQPRLVGWGLRLFGGRMFPEMPYEDLFLLPMARQFRERLSTPLILLGGVNGRTDVDRAMAEGFDFVAMGRALLREPDLPIRMATHPRAAGLCVHCNKCVPTIYSGTRCVLREGPASSPTPRGDSTIR